MIIGHGDSAGNNVRRACSTNPIESADAWGLEHANTINGIMDKAVDQLKRLGFPEPMVQALRYSPLPIQTILVFACYGGRKAKKSKK